MTENKRKLLIIIAAVLIFVTLAAGILALQNNLLSTEGASSPDSISSEISLSEPQSEESKESEESVKSEESKPDSSSSEASSSEKNENTSSEPKPEVSSKPSKEESPKESSSSASSAVSKPSSSSSEASSSEEKTESVSVTFYNAIEDKQILTGTVELSTEKAASDVSVSLLKENGIKYSTTGGGATFYFSMIDGLRERGAGPMSGWIFFVKRAGESDYIRSSIGAGSTTLQDGDSILWQYLERY